MLTDKALKALKPKAAIYEVADRDGLSVRVIPGGSITFQYRYRIRGRSERFKLGRYGTCGQTSRPGMTLAEAREALDKARKLVAQGISPIRHKRESQELQERAEREGRGPDTVRGLSEEFLTRYIEREHKNPGYARQILSADVLPALGEIRVKDVTRRDVVRMLDGIVDRGARIQANRTAALAKQMFQFAVERGIIDTNFCSDIRRQTVGGTEESRSRVLNHEEIRALWRSLDRLSQAKQLETKPAPGRKLKPEERKHAWISKPLALALQLLLTTGQRRGELIKAKWVDVDLGDALWTVPAENSKNGRAHVVPLSSLALKLFGDLKGLARDSVYVLPGYAGSKAITERALTKAAERARPWVMIQKDTRTEVVAHWTPHDLRRTVATQLSDLGVLPHIVEKVLNHTMQGVMAVYNRHDYMSERRQAFDLWGDRLRAIIEAEDGKVKFLGRKVA
jgi:integrase